jgi:hypothetical protein
MVHLNDAEKKKVFAGLKPILQEWAGVRLKPTSCYGVRMYYNGSWLRYRHLTLTHLFSSVCFEVEVLVIHSPLLQSCREHVDKSSTHIISAIAQIAQEGMEEPWALSFVDHKGERHYITMEVST